MEKEELGVINSGGIVEDGGVVVFWAIFLLFVCLPVLEIDFVRDSAGR